MNEGVIPHSSSFWSVFFFLYLPRVETPADMEKHLTFNQPPPRHAPVPPRPPADRAWLTRAHGPPDLHRLIETRLPRFSVRAWVNAHGGMGCLMLDAALGFRRTTALSVVGDVRRVAMGGPRRLHYHINYIHVVAAAVDWCYCYGFYTFALRWKGTGINRLFPHRRRRDCTHTYTHTHIHTHTYLYFPTHTCAQTQAAFFIEIPYRRHACTRTRTCTNTHTHTHTNTQTRTHTCQVQWDWLWFALRLLKSQAEGEHVYERFCVYALVCVRVCVRVCVCLISHECSWCSKRMNWILLSRLYKNL